MGLWRSEGILFEGGEVEGAVGDDASADDTAEVILAHASAVEAGAVGEPIVGIEALVAEISEG